MDAHLDLDDDDAENVNGDELMIRWRWIVDKQLNKQTRSDCLY